MTFISQINSACSEDALREVLMGEEVLDSILEAGFTKPISSVTLLEKNDIVSTITTYHLFLKVYNFIFNFYTDIIAKPVDHISEG